MRVLAYVPLAPQTPKIYSRTLLGLFRMNWPHPIDYVFGRQDHKPLHKEAAYNEITDKFNRARDIALNGDYDAMLTVESDVILPPLALERMSRVDADVVYGLYVSRHGNHQWLAASRLDERTADYLSDDLEFCRQAWGEVVDTVGVGMGCTLIHRPVLERIRFRRREGLLANDWYFALDCQTTGFKQAHDLGVVCGHMEAHPSPRIYWPNPEELMGYSIEYLGDEDVRPVRDKEEIVVSGFKAVELVKGLPPSDPPHGGGGG